MNNEHRAYCSLAGTGKTTLLVEDAVKRINNGENILYLSFSKRLTYDVLDNGVGYLNGHHVKTFHQVAFDEVIRSDVFRFTNFKREYEHLLDDYETSSDKMEKEELKKILNMKEDLTELLKWWVDHKSQTQYKNLTHIYVDEFQDMSKELMDMVVKLYEVNQRNGVSLTVAGDNYQSIYGFLNGGRIVDNFRKFGLLFGPYETIPLRTCYRMSPGLQTFVNGYYELNYNSDKYFDLSRFNPMDYTKDVFIHTITHKSKVNDLVNEIVRSYPKKQVVVLARTNKEVDHLKCYVQRNLKRTDRFPLMQFSTIHSYKGGEQDVAVLVNTMYGDKFNTKEEKNVWNVAITRGKEKLHIVTSFPEERILPHFKEGTYTLISGQEKKVRRPISMVPEETAPLTTMNAEMSLIDSIEIKVGFGDLPFIPREKQNLGKTPFGTRSVMTSLNMEYVLCKYSQSLRFDFKDLTKLKSLGYDDYLVMEYLLEIMREYTNYSIEDKVLMESPLRRLDLSKLVRVSSEKVIDTLKYFFKLSNYNTNDEGKVVMFPDHEPIEKTLYLNSHTVKKENGKENRYRVIRAYFPVYKTRNTLVDGERVLKVELQRTRKSFTKDEKYGPPKTIQDLMEHITSTLGGLDDLYYQWLYDEFPYLREDPITNIDLHMKRRGIDSLMDIQRHIEMGLVKPKDRKVYFYMLLSLIPKEEREDIIRIFNIHR
jgi:hypothetical protein